jgi:hypothetical protein
MPQLSSIVVTPPSPSLVAGQTQQFIATGIYNNGGSADLTGASVWASSDAAVATIDAAGLATAIAPGVATISATSAAITGSTDLIAGALQLTALAVLPSALPMQVGQAQQFSAMGTYSDLSTADLTGEVTWVSSAPAVATISNAGLATAISAGTATITAESGALSGAGTLTAATSTAPPIVSPAPPGSPAAYLAQAQQAMFQLLLGNKPSRVATPQLGETEFVATTPAQLQRAIDYLQGLVMDGNVWPSDPSAGSLTSGYTRGRKPFSFYGWP